jgi:Flp pilus assembly protein TadG
MIAAYDDLRRRLKLFARARAGNVALTFALATFPIIGAVGAAVDYSHANSVKSAMQAALDSTALMLSRDVATLNDTQLQSKATNYFTALFTRPEATNVTVTASYTTTGGSAVVINSSANVPTAIMGIVGYDHIEVTASATAKWGSQRLRVALALDNTGSMADAGKMTALKSATKALLTQLKNAASVNGDVYVSIIPFNKDVNVGSSNSAANWINWSLWDAANSGSGNISGSICYNGTLWEVSGNSVHNGGSCSGTSGGICYGGTLWKYNGTTFYSAGTCTHTTWNGCITDRGLTTGPSTSDYDRKVTAPTTSIVDSLFVAEQYGSCPVAMMGLSYDWTTLNGLVDSMVADGNTNQPIGLVWAWQSLVGGGPLTAPAKDSNYTYKDIIILMSDGLNTQDRWYSNQTQVDKRMYDSSNSGAGTCANIKAAGIQIYTIHVNTNGDPLSTLLQNCASSSDKFWMITSASDLGTVFNTIGTNLTKLRVAK